MIMLRLQVFLDTCSRFCVFVAIRSCGREWKLIFLNEFIMSIIKHESH